ncbi:bifunctional UDP-N-acetylglucosamine diphosphorylase/glucosamine-1-phosphate N-acetyltransferase GlmU, partial [bacterium]|nr:bifunctional UDP-N-acetylglucosamine diphosphorylase/glucosamine-1-phosphate N-acetyltransferase GlmU [bacterium]
MSLRVIVLAAGKGTRMKSDLPKVLHRVAGRPIVSWVVESVSALDPSEIVVVIGHGADEVSDALPAAVRTVVQDPQNGTGHAVMVALEAMGDVAGDTIVVVPGDAPLVRPESLQAMVAAHHGADATLLTTVMPEPFGYGRILRDGDRVRGIIEEGDADDEQRSITEVGVSIYAFDGAALKGALDRLTNENALGEYYLTDTIGALSDGEVRAVAAADPVDVQGINSHDQLAAVNEEMRSRINRDLMLAGVWMLDPSRVYIDAGVDVAPGARIHPGVYLHGDTSIGAGAEIGPEVFAVDSSVGAGSRVWYSVLRGAEVGDDVEVGPFASLRPGTRLAPGSKAGTFVETKNTDVGPGAKVPHLSYIGDASIGEGSNIGAGTITCNYDG